MADIIQCDNCGAILADEDLFCGECGAPRAIAETPDPAEKPISEAEAPPDSPSQPSPRPSTVIRPKVMPSTRAAPATTTAPTSSSNQAWRVAFIVLLVLGIIACLIGLAGFLLVGLVGAEGNTSQENWMASTLVCLLPFGGVGAILAAAAVAIRYARLKNR